MSYQELKKRHQEEVNNFPMFFAFSNEQFEEGLKRFGIKDENIKSELLSIGSGGFIRKSDSKALDDLFKRQKEEMKQARKEDKLLISAIEYELQNHEYIITYNPEDTIAALNLDMDDPRIKKCFKTARKNYLKSMEENGCFS